MIYVDITPENTNGTVRDENVRDVPELAAGAEIVGSGDRSGEDGPGHGTGDEGALSPASDRERQRAAVVSALRNAPDYRSELIDAAFAYGAASSAYGRAWDIGGLGEAGRKMDGARDRFLRIIYG